MHVYQQVDVFHTLDPWKKNWRIIFSTLMHWRLSFKFNHQSLNYFRKPFSWTAVSEGFCWSFEGHIFVRGFSGSFTPIGSLNFVYREAVCWGTSLYNLGFKCIIPSGMVIFICISNLCIWVFCLHIHMCTVCTPEAHEGQKMVSDPLKL